MSARDAIDEILVIDDREDHLAELRDGLAAELGREALITVWRPETGEHGPNAIELLAERVGPKTTLVVTDHDLSTTMRGLFGSTIVAWCQNRGIPVCNCSRQTPEALPSTPGLFEFRLSPQISETVSEAARIFQGFRDLRVLVDAERDLSASRSPGQLLAHVLENPGAEFEFSPYFASSAAANGALLGTLSSRRGNATLRSLMGYILGHVLGNSIMKFPGPILNSESLGALLGTAPVADPEVQALFAAAVYTGPFSRNRDYFWRSRVAEIIDEYEDESFATAALSQDQRYRLIVERALGRALPAHDCERCDGTRGGFWCPFEKRPVCDRSDCSVSASSWIPDGAWVTRIERDFYDEWAPALGY